MGFTGVEAFAGGVDSTGTELVFVVVEYVTDSGDGVVQVRLVDDVLLITGCGAIDEFDVMDRLRVLLLEVP